MDHWKFRPGPVWRVTPDDAPFLLFCIAVGVIAGIITVALL